MESPIVTLTHASKSFVDGKDTHQRVGKCRLRFGNRGKRGFDRGEWQWERVLC